MGKINIAGRQIGVGEPCFILAEAGVNHNGSLELALHMVDAAVAAGVDGIKFQTFKTDKLVSFKAPKANYQAHWTGSNGSQMEMIKQLELTFENFEVISRYCSERGIIFLSTPFEEESADFLESIGMAAYKMASGELTNLPFQAHVARKGNPMIVSTGMSTMTEISDTVSIIHESGNPPLMLLHCTSNYPTSAQEVNLRAMHTLSSSFHVPVGYSDHTEGIEISGIAVALGACLLEKHFTLDRQMPGPDHQASLEPGELAALVQSVRRIETALGTGEKIPTRSEENTALVARKSLHLRTDLPARHSLKTDDLVALRPGTGISPSMLDHVVGHQLKKAMHAGSMLRESDID